MRSLRIKFILYLTPLVIFISLAFLIFFIGRSNYLVKENLRELGFSLVKSLAYSSELAIASEDEIFLKPYLEKIFKEKDVVLVAIYNKEGRLLLSKKKTELDERMPSEVMKKLLINKETLRGKSGIGEENEIYDFYAPIFISDILSPRPGQVGQELAGFARVDLSLERMMVQNKEIIVGGLLITVILVLLGLATSIFLSQKMTKPILQLAKGVSVVGKGNLGHRIQIKTGDEIETLAEDFNKMTEKLSKSRAALEESKKVLEIKVVARTKELQELTASLEDKVRERTRELQERIDELERFHRLTVGREIKMIELKEELQKAQETIKNLKGREI